MQYGVLEWSGRELIRAKSSVTRLNMKSVVSVVDCVKEEELGLFG